MATLAFKESRFLKVPLVDAELQARGQQLADLIKQSQDLAVEHKAARGRMKEGAEILDGHINKLAVIVNERVEERAVEVEVRIDLGLRMVEEIRTDTGEVVRTRQSTADDKLRAEMAAQKEMEFKDGRPKAE